jgi:hypothetical protein
LADLSVAQVATLLTLAVVAAVRRLLAAIVLQVSAARAVTAQTFQHLFQVQPRFVQVVQGVGVLHLVVRLVLAVQVLVERLLVQQQQRTQVQVVAAV